MERDQETENSTRKRRLGVLKWVAVAVFVVVVGAFMLIRLGALTSPREFAVERLEERFDDVQLESLELGAASGWSLLPRIAATGRGLSVSLPDREDAPPFVSMERFTVELDVIGLLRDPIRIRRLNVDRLEIQIPPGRDDGNEDGDDGKDTGDSAPPAFVVEELEADGTTLRILPSYDEPEDDKDAKPKEPLVFELHQLRVDSAGIGEPMKFDAVLENAKPPGQVTTTGSFGPIVLSDVGESPVSGVYTFERAKLEDFAGIAGTLYSEGEFGGVLARLEAAGFTETPDFQLSSAGHPISLTTEYEATIDGTNGDTFLTPVIAVLGESRIETRGGVFQRIGTDGKTVCLDANAPDGRIEDFLRLAVASEQALMTGDILFKSLILIPPGEKPVVEKLVLDGEFAIGSARFPDRKIQDKVDALSKAGRGEGGGEANAVDRLRQERVLSDISARFSLGDGVMTLRDVSFTVPGASVKLNGTYGLVSEELAFRGELRLDAKVSETTDGFKSFLLKLVDPLLSSDDAGAVIPIKIGGTPTSPDFGVELGRVLTGRELTEPSAAGGTELHATIASCREILDSPKLDRVSEKRTTDNR